MNQILDIYNTKGIYDKNSAVILFKPFFQTIDITTDITMKELYDLTSIELFFYTVEINKFVLKELSYIHTPDLSVIEAIYMSSTLPIIMIPLVKNNNECYVDGGLLCNYPINELLKNKVENNEILGINYNYNILQKKVINEKTNLVDYIITILINIIFIIAKLISEKSKEADVKMYQHFYEMRQFCTQEQQVRYDTIVPKLINRSGRGNRR
jgi:predicted acylesterase/phospholipase RssA